MNPKPNIHQLKITRYDDLSDLADSATDMEGEWKDQF